MALGELVVVLAVMGLLLFLVVRAGLALTGSDRQPPARLVAGGRWEAGHEAGPGFTRVTVQHVVGEAVVEVREVGQVPDDAADWEGAFHEAMSRARSRAAALNSER